MAKKLTGIQAMIAERLKEAGMIPEKEKVKEDDNKK